MFQRLSDGSLMKLIKGRTVKLFNPSFKYPPQVGKQQAQRNRSQALHTALVNGFPLLQTVGNKRVSLLRQHQVADAAKLRAAKAPAMPVCDHPAGLTSPRQAEYNNEAGVTRS